MQVYPSSDNLLYKLSNISPHHFSYYPNFYFSSRNQKNAEKLSGIFNNLIVPKKLMKVNLNPPASKGIDLSEH